MSNLKISYCVTCHDETDTLDRLLSGLCSVQTTDEIIVQSDSNVTNETLNIINKYKLNIVYYSYPLNNNYAQFKNTFIEHASGDWIFSIDADEFPPTSLIGENLHALIEDNPTREAYRVPRINAWIGLTSTHHKWGKYTSQSPTYQRLRATWPDWQLRIFKNDYPRIHWENTWSDPTSGLKAHETIFGLNIPDEWGLNYFNLPEDESWALYHDKTIEKQEISDLKY